MAAAANHPAILDRLRANTRAVGVVLSDDEIAAIAAGPFFGNVEAFGRLSDAAPTETVPDLAKAWQPMAEPAGVAGGGAPVAAADDPLDPFASLAVMAAAVARRQVSPVELVRTALERISSHDGRLNAFQCVLADVALDRARAAERAVNGGLPLGPLHGVPVAVKDLLDMAGVPTTAGSKILADSVARADAWAVARLREAGAIIVGKTRMSEFAYSPASNNAHYGPTHNPWSLAHDTGGSSSGSAAAVAAGLVPLALGTDTGCSIRTPSALCGLVGLKPTHGRVSLAGAVTLSWSLDHLGPMTRSVRDAAIALNVLAGLDPRDARTRPGTVPDFAAGLDDGDWLKGKRVGAIREDGSPFGPAEPEALVAWEAGLAALRAAGAVVVDLQLPELETIRAAASAIITLEAIAFHEPWLRTRRQDYGEFARMRLLAGYAYAPNTYVRAQQIRANVRARLEAVWQQVDLLSTPALAYGAPPLGEPRSNTRFMVPFNALGWPAIVVPSGLTADGRPLATHVIGRPWDECGVLRAARAIEWAGLLAGRRPPGF